MTTTKSTEYHARARATLGGELATLADHLTTDQLDALATEVVAEVLANDRGFSEYVTEYVRNITASSASDADQLRKVRSYADILLGVGDGSQPVTFQEAMDTECGECGEKAAMHRLTSSGNFYCLIPARGYDHAWWTSSRPAYNYVRPVRELRRSSLGAEVGSVILAGLTQAVAA